MVSVLYLVLGFILMEVASWAIHKYLMHGPLWFIHKTHHQPGKGFFELNDVFSISFGSVAVLLIIFGLENLDFRFWLGLGITLYGFSYFVFHDLIIHKRINVGAKPASKFLKGISKAHRDHHKTREREGAVCFGLLLVPMKYFKSK